MNILKFSWTLKNSSEDTKMLAVKRLAILGIKNKFSKYPDDIFETQRTGFLKLVFYK
jgi:hypothetical protein